MTTTFDLWGNIIEKHYINGHELKKTNTMKSIINFKLSQENIFFLLETSIKNDLIIY